MAPSGTIKPAAGGSSHPTDATAQAGHAGPPTVVVGVDGSVGSVWALDWAADEAERRKAQLRIVHSWDPSDVSWTSEIDVETRHELQREGRSLLRNSALAAGTGRALHADTSLCTGPAAEVLVEQSAGAELVVVGTRRQGGSLNAIFGSVSTRVVEQSVIPVAVVAADCNAPAVRTSPLVAGINGTELDEAVLAYAFAAADQRRRGLIVASCWEPHSATRSSPDLARVATAESLAGWQERFPDVEVQVRTLDGTPWQCLDDLASATELVVVGRRKEPLGRLRGLHATAVRVSRTAHAVVVVVPG